MLDRLADLTPEHAERMVRATVGVLATYELWDECLAALQHFPITDIIASILKESLAELLTAGRITTVKRWVELAQANQVSDPMLLLARPRSPCETARIPVLRFSAPKQAGC